MKTYSDFMKDLRKEKDPKKALFLYYSRLLDVAEEESKKPTPGDNLSGYLSIASDLEFILKDL